MLPQILTQLGPEGLQHLKRLANNVVAGNKLLSSVNEEEADDVPNLVGNFEEVAAQTEVTKVEEKKADAKKIEELAAQVADAAIAEEKQEAKEEKKKPAEPAKKETPTKKATDEKPKQGNDKGGKKKSPQQSKDKKA